MYSVIHIAIHIAIAIHMAIVIAKSIAIEMDIVVFGFPIIGSSSSPSV